MPAAGSGCFSSCRNSPSKLRLRTAKLAGRNTVSAASNTSAVSPSAPKAYNPARQGRSTRCWRMSSSDGMARLHTGFQDAQAKRIKLDPGGPSAHRCQAMGCHSGHRVHLQEKGPTGAINNEVHPAPAATPEHTGSAQDEFMQGLRLFRPPTGAVGKGAVRK